MTDMKPRHRFLLPVVSLGRAYSDPHYRSVNLACGGHIFLSEETLETLIPADRITELEAEVSRLKSELEKLK